ncbi:MAG: MucR family transcriptional regulator [Alphaproteobacteria bacterium]|nr:MucR family transcriptional regulator [Alphaproteobacteria bacterium]MBR1480265.1 MucR family transcriptional regulator [Alphaproteobacteria bacterium]
MVEKLNKQDALSPQEIMGYTTEIASAYLAGNEVAREDLPEVLRGIFLSILDITRDANNTKLCSSQKPAVPVEESVHDDYIVCLEDGHKLKMLKRHLMSRYGLTVDEYRAKWNLPADYPVVAKNYSEKRSRIAVEKELGRSRTSKAA